MKTFIYSRKSWTLLIVALVLIYFSASIINTQLFKRFRLDFTQESLHTISDGTKTVLSAIDEPIAIKIYFSQRLGQISPQYKDFYDRLKTFLQNYKRLSNGNLDITFFTPEPYSELEDEALLAGLKSATISSLSEQVYFGLIATNSINKKEIIPFFDLQRQQFLEYDLSLIVHKLSQSKALRVGVLSGLDSFSDTLMMKQLGSLFDIDTLDREMKEISEDIQTLLVIAPEELSKKSIFAIDQYALRGGNILLFTDPLIEGDKQLKQENKYLVKELLKAWGVEYDVSTISIDAQYAVSVNSNTPSGAKSFKHPAWLEITNQSFAQDNIITSNLEKITVASSGFLTQSKEANNSDNKFIPLVQTSPIAMQRPSEMFRNLNAKVLVDSYKKGDKTLTISAHISTKDVASIFEQGFVDEENNTTIKAKLVKSIENVNAIIIADTDILRNNMWARANNFLGQSMIIPIADNGRFITNAIENLNGNDAFISLRGRGKVTRPFTLLADMQREAEQKFLQTESNLRQKLSQLQAKIHQQRQNIKDSTLLTKEQQKLIDQAQNEMVNVRKELRSVQHNLRKDIESVKNIFKWSNILGVPILIILFGLFLNRYRNNKRKKYFL